MKKTTIKKISRKILCVWVLKNKLLNRYDSVKKLKRKIRKPFELKKKKKENYIYIYIPQYMRCC